MLKKEKLCEYYESIIETSLDCIKIFDLEGNLFYMNPAGIKEHNLGNLENALKQNWKVTDCIEDRDKPKFIQSVQDTIKKGTISTVEIAHTKDGSDRDFCLEIIGPIKNKEGETIGTFGLSRDLTEIKKRELDTSKKLEDLERLNKLMTGREIKMIELKKEILELKKRLNEN